MNRRRKSRAKSQELDQSATNTAEEFSFSLIKVAVCQICRSVGYRATDSSALNTLTLITTKYLQSLAGLAASFSNTANRTEVNLFDIVNGLQDISLSFTDGFPGGSTDAHCLIKSGVLRNLSDFVSYAPEIPFAKPLPRQESHGSSEGSLTHVPNAPPTLLPEVKSIPRWLPPFPDASLYIEQCKQHRRSDHLWEHSDSVRETTFSCENLPEISKSQSSNGRSDGRLPKRREIVRFKVERAGRRIDTSSCTSKMRLERWRESGGESEPDCEVDSKKKIGEEYIYGGGFVAGECLI